MIIDYGHIIEQGSHSDVLKQKYRDYLKIAIISYDELHFYENRGYTKADDASPMFITSLWT